MALRKKKNPQNDSEKLQALLQSWDIQIPEKDKKSDFPETSLNDFPKADFPERKPEILPSVTELRKETPKPEVQTVSLEKKETRKETPKPEIKTVSLEKKELDTETEQKFRAIFQEHRQKKSEKKPGLSLLTIDNPELDRKFKQEAIQYMRGTVRLFSPELFFIIAILIIFGLSVMYQVFICFSILAFAAAAFLLWYAFRWKLTFDGSTNRFSYQALNCPEVHFHVSEIESLQIKSGFRSPAEQMILTVHGTKIRISMGFPQSWLTGRPGEYLGGCYHALKLREYLEFYQALHGRFPESGFSYSGRRKKSDASSSSREELMQMLAQYQKQIDDNRKE